MGIVQLGKSSQVSLLSYIPGSFTWSLSLKNSLVPCTSLVQSRCLFFMWGLNNKILSCGSLEICLASAVNCTHLLAGPMPGKPHSNGLVHHNPRPYHPAASASDFVWCSGELYHPGGDKNRWLCYRYICALSSSEVIKLIMPVSPPYRTPVSITFIISFFALGL